MKEEADGIIGFNDSGQPIVTSSHHCKHFAEQKDSVMTMRECWYCKYADFRKTTDAEISQSICRHPANAVRVKATRSKVSAVALQKKLKEYLDEGGELPDDVLDAVAGGLFQYDEEKGKDGQE